MNNWDGSCVGVQRRYFVIEGQQRIADPCVHVVQNVAKQTNIWGKNLSDTVAFAKVSDILWKAKVHICFNKHKEQKEDLSILNVFKCVVTFHTDLNYKGVCSCLYFNHQTADRTNWGFHQPTSPWIKTWYAFSWQEVRFSFKRWLALLDKIRKWTHISKNPNRHAVH